MAYQSYSSPSAPMQHQGESSGSGYHAQTGQTYSRPRPESQSEHSHYYHAPVQQAQPPSMAGQQRLAGQGFQQQQGYQTYQGGHQPQYSMIGSIQPSVEQLGGQLQVMPFSGQGQHWNQQAAAGSTAGPSQSPAHPQHWYSFQSAINGPGQDHTRQTIQHPSPLSDRSYGGSAPYGLSSLSHPGSSGDGQPSHLHHLRRNAPGNSARSTLVQHNTAPPFLPSGSANTMSRLPAKPTFEPAGGVPMPLGGQPMLHNLGPAAAAAPNPYGDSTAAAALSWSTSATPTTSKHYAQNKSSSSLGAQLLDKLPPLPSLPAVKERPANLAEIKGPEREEETQRYLHSLLEAIEVYKAREEAMQLRIEALAFRPVESWRRITAEMAGSREGQTFTSAATAVEGTRRHGEVTAAQTDVQGPAPVLGVRLLRRIAKLQIQNDELESLLSQKLNLNDHQQAAGDEVKGNDKTGEDGAQMEGQTHSSPHSPGPTGNGTSFAIPSCVTTSGREIADLQDAHRLLSQLSEALTASQARAQRAERALEATVQVRSTAL